MKGRPEGTFWYLIDEFEEYCRARNLSRHTVRSRTLWLRTFGKYLEAGALPDDAHEIRRAHLEGFIGSELARGISPVSLQTGYGSLKSFWGWYEGIDDYLRPETWRSPMAHMRQPKAPEAAPPPVLTTDEVRRLIDACKTAPVRGPKAALFAAGARDPRFERFMSLRDETIVRILYDTGLRRAELASMTVEDADGALARRSDEGGTFMVIGKGRKQRVLHLSRRTRRMLLAYVRERKAFAVRHQIADEPALWIGLHGRMAADGIYLALKRRAKVAGLTAFWPHLLRHTSVDALLSAGMDSQDVKRLMGWTTANMLDRYAAGRATQRAVEAHRRLAIGDKL